MSKCLVTGHKGFIGSHLFEELKRQGHDVVGIDFKNDERYDILEVFKTVDSGLEYCGGLKNKPEYIFHLAAIPRIGYSIEHPVKTMRNNILSTTYMLDFAHAVGIKRFIYSSSSMAGVTGPTSPYALQKATSEKEVELWSSLYGLDAVSLRYFNVYHKEQPAEGSYATAVAAWMKCIKEGYNPFITGIGDQRRDMLHVSDAVRANIMAMEHDGAFQGEQFEIGTGKNISLSELASILTKHYPDVEFDVRPARPNEVMETKADAKRTKKGLGFATKVSITKGVEECFKK
tara:strand:- start:4443 stop:5306 length:864 start_codon:yes stop_codon:yes gene_type:complete